MVNGWLRSIFFWGLLPLGALAACPDPGERFQEFVDRTEPFREPPGDLGESVLSDLNGRFLLAASVELGPTTPLFFDVEIETNYGGQATCPQEGCLLHMKILPLVSPSVVGVVCEPPFTPTGIAVGNELPDELRQNPEPVEIRDIPVRSDGSFLANLPLLAVDGCANAITGRPIVAQLNLNSVTKSADRFCGKLEGDVVEPLEASLTRSTFGAERIEGDPADLDPVPILSACPEEDDEEEEEEDAS